VSQQGQSGDCRGEEKNSGSGWGELGMQAQAGRSKGSKTG